MKNKKLIFSFLLFFGLCFAMLNRVTAVSAAENVKLNVEAVSVTMGGSFTLKTYNSSENQVVIYRSSDTKVATVSRNGVITGVKCGTAKVEATVIEDGATVATLYCDVVVGPVAISIKFTKTDVVLCEGKSRLLKTIIVPINTVEQPIFFSEHTDIATVSAAGRVRAKSTGVVKVFAILANGQYSVCNIVIVSEQEYENYLEGKSVEELVEEFGSLEECESEDPETEDTEDEISVMDPRIARVLEKEAQKMME